MTLTRVEALAATAERVLGRPVGQVDTEYCYYVEMTTSPAPPNSAMPGWLSFATSSRRPSSRTVRPRQLPRRPLRDRPRVRTASELRDRLVVDAVEICRRSGVRSVSRLERSVRIGLPAAVSDEQAEEILGLLHDRMTEMPYREPLTSFETGLAPATGRR